MADESMRDAGESSDESFEFEDDQADLASSIANRTRHGLPAGQLLSHQGDQKEGSNPEGKPAVQLPAKPKFKVETCTKCGKRRVVGVESPKSIFLYPSDRGRQIDIEGKLTFTCSGNASSSAAGADAGAGADDGVVEHRCGQAEIGWLIQQDHIKNKKPVTTTGNVYADLSALFTFVQACGGADVWQSVAIPNTNVKAPGHIAAKLKMTTTSRATALASKYRTVFLTPGRVTRQTLEAQLLGREDVRATLTQQRQTCRELLGIIEDDVSLARDLTAHQKFRGVCVDLKNSDQLHETIAEIEATADRFGFASAIAELRSSHLQHEHVALLGDSGVGKSMLLGKLILASADFRSTSDTSRGRAAEQLADAIVSGVVTSADEQFDGYAGADSGDESTCEEADAESALGPGYPEASPLPSVVSQTALRKFTFTLDDTERTRVLSKVAEYASTNPHEAGHSSLPLLLPKGAVGTSTTAAVVRVQQGDRFSAVLEFCTVDELRTLVWEGLEALNDVDSERASKNAEYLRQFINKPAAEEENRRSDGQCDDDDDDEFIILDDIAIVRRATECAKSPAELNLRADLLEVAGAVLTVPGSNTTDARADYLVARYVLHCVQGINPADTVSEGWCPGQPAAVERANLLGPFAALLSGDSSTAAEYGKLVLPALKYVTVFTCSRVPLRLLPMFDMPGSNDPEFAKELVLEQELKRTAFVLVVVENNPSNTVIGKLASWSPLRNWDPATPLPFALVFNVNKRTEYDTDTVAGLNNLTKHRANRQARLKEVAMKVVKDLVTSGCFRDPRTQKLAYTELCTNGRAVFEPAINVFEKDMQALTSKSACTTHGDEVHELHLLLGMLSERSRRNAADRLEKCLSAINESDATASGKKVRVSTSSSTAVVVMNDKWRLKNVKEIALKFSSTLDRCLAAHAATITSTEPDAIVEAAIKAVAEFIGSNIDGLKSAHKTYLLKKLPKVDYNRMTSSVAERGLRETLCKWDDAVYECLKTKLDGLGLGTFVVALGDDLHELAGSSAEMLKRLTYASWETLRSKCLDARKPAGVVTYNNCHANVSSVVTAISDALRESFKRGVSEVCQRFEDLMNAFKREVIGPVTANYRGRCLTNIIFKDAIQASRYELGRGGVSPAEVMDSLRKQLVPALEEARMNRPREELGTNVVADIRALRIQEAVASLAVLGTHASLAPPMDVTGRERYELFDPDLHLQKLKDMIADTKQWVEPLSTHVRGSFGIIVEVPTHIHYSRVKYGTLYALTSDKTWGKCDQRTLKRVRENDLPALLWAWSHILRDREPAMMQSWESWPDWLQELVVLTNAYGRPANLIVPNVIDGSSTLDTDVPATIIHFSVHYPRRSDASDTIMFLGYRSSAGAPILLPCDSSGTKNHAIARQAPSLQEATAIELDQPSHPPVILQTRSAQMVKPYVVRKLKFPVLHLNAWKQTPDCWSVEFVDPKQQVKKYGLTFGDFHTLASEYLSFGEFCSWSKPKAQAVESQDADFVNWRACVAGVFDGVGSLPQSGTWSRCVASAIGNAADGQIGQSNLMPDNRARGITDEGLSVLKSNAKLAGATTGVVFALANVQDDGSALSQYLHWVSWGDSVGAVFRRNGECVFVTPPGYDERARMPNTPVQLVSPCSNGELPTGKREGTVRVRPGDILILASDGLTDNLREGRRNIRDQDELRQLLSKCAEEHLGPTGESQQYSVGLLCDAFVTRLQRIMDRPHGKRDDAVVVAVELRLGAPLENDAQVSLAARDGATTRFRTQDSRLLGTKSKRFASAALDDLDDSVLAQYRQSNEFAGSAGSTGSDTYDTADDQNARPTPSSVKHHRSNP